MSERSERTARAAESGGRGSGANWPERPRAEDRGASERPERPRAGDGEGASERPERPRAGDGERSERTGPSGRERGSRSEPRASAERRRVPMGRRGSFVASVRTSGAAIGDRVRRRLPAALVLGAGVLALAGCAQADRPQSTMDPKGDYAQKIFNLSWPVFLIAGHRRRHRVRHADRGLRPLPGAAGPHGDAEAGARQPGARDRSHGPPGRPAGGHRRADDQGPVRAQRHAEGPTGRQRVRPAVVVGVRLPVDQGRRQPAPRHRQRDGHPRRSPGGAEHHLPRRHPLVLDPEAQRQARRRARPRPAAANLQADAARRVLGPVHRVLRPLPRQHAHAGRRADAGRLRPLGRAASRPTPAAASTDAAKAGEAQFKSLCASCHQVNGLKDANGEQIVAQPQTQVYTGPRRTSPT